MAILFLLVLSRLFVSDSATLMGCSSCQAPLSVGILQARVLEWVAMLSSRGPSQPRTQTCVSCTAGVFFTVWAIRKSRNTAVGGLSLLQGIFLTQELNWDLMHWRRILYQLSYQGSPFFSLGLINAHLIEFIFLINGKHLLWMKIAINHFVIPEYFQNEYCLKQVNSWLDTGNFYYWNIYFFIYLFL